MSLAVRSLRPRLRRLGPAPRPRKKPHPPRTRRGHLAAHLLGRQQGTVALALSVATPPSRGSRVAFSLAKRRAARHAVFRPAARPVEARLSANKAAAPRIVADRPGAAGRRRAPPQPSAPSLAAVAGPPALGVPSHPARRIEPSRQPFRPLPHPAPRQSSRPAANHRGAGHPQRLPAQAVEARAFQLETGSGPAPARPARLTNPGAGQPRDPPRPSGSLDPRATAWRDPRHNRPRGPLWVPPPRPRLPYDSKASPMRSGPSLSTMATGPSPRRPPGPPAAARHSPGSKSNASARREE